MNNKGLLYTIFTFCFGVVLGAFVATIVIREAVPLRDHYVAIIISFVFSSIIILCLIVWYMRLVNSCKRAFGEKGGRIINSIISFMVVSISLLYILVVSIFYMAIA